MLHAVSGIPNSTLDQSAGHAQEWAVPSLQIWQSFKPLTCCLQSLAYHSALHSRAQAMRMNGQSQANMGMADDLPAHLSAEQLRSSIAV